MLLLVGRFDDAYCCSHLFVCFDGFSFPPEWSLSSLLSLFFFFFFLKISGLWLSVLCPGIWNSPCVCTKLLQSCSTLCDPMDCSPPGSSVHGIFQVRILEWVAMPSSRGSSRPRDRIGISYISCIGRRTLLPLMPSGTPKALPSFLIFNSR